jgi:hypothetical protein
MNANTDVLHGGHRLKTQITFESSGSLSNTFSLWGLEKGSQQEKEAAAGAHADSLHGSWHPRAPWSWRQEGSLPLCQVVHTAGTRTH